MLTRILLHPHSFFNHTVTSNTQHSNNNQTNQPTMLWPHEKNLGEEREKKPEESMFLLKIILVSQFKELKLEYMISDGFTPSLGPVMRKMKPNQARIRAPNLTTPWIKDPIWKSRNLCPLGTSS